MTTNSIEALQQKISRLPEVRISAFIRALRVAAEEAKSTYQANAWRPESEWDKGYWQGLEEALSLVEEFLTEGK